jgi:hypothetical protein
MAAALAMLAGSFAAEPLLARNAAVLTLWALLALGAALIAAAAPLRSAACWILATIAVAIGMWMFAGGAAPASEVGHAVMLPASSIILLGTALVLSQRANSQRRRLAMAMSLAASVMPWIAILSYASAMSPFSAPLAGGHGGISIVTGALLLTTAVGIIGLWPQHGFAALVASPSSGGLLLRVLLPAAMVVPVAIGWIFDYGEAAGWFGATFRAELNLGTASLVFGGLVLWIGLLFKRREAEQRTAAEERERLLAELRVSLDQLGALQNGLLTICAWSKRVLDEGKWVQFEEFLEKRLHINVTHSISEDSSDDELTHLMNPQEK